MKTLSFAGLPTLLLAASLCAQAETPESGFWFSPEEPGTAFFFQTEGNNVFVSWLNYDESGVPIWYVGAGQLQQTEAATAELEVELQEYRFGQCAGCDWRQAQLVATTMPLLVEFDGRARAIATFAGVQSLIRPFKAAKPNYYTDDYFAGKWLFHFEETSATEMLVFGSVIPLPPGIECSPPCAVEHEVIEASVEDRILYCLPPTNYGCQLATTTEVLASFDREGIGRDSMIGYRENGSRVVAVRLP